MESWLSGRKRLTANEVGVLKPLVGSNPTLSAKTRSRLRRQSATMFLPESVGFESRRRAEAEAG